MDGAMIELQMAASRLAAAIEEGQSPEQVISNVCYDVFDNNNQFLLGWNFGSSISASWETSVTGGISVISFVFLVQFVFGLNQIYSLSSFSFQFSKTGKENHLRTTRVTDNSRSHRTHKSFRRIAWTRA